MPVDAKALRTPDTVPNERTIKGEKVSAVRVEAEEPGKSQKRESEGDRRARMESDAEERFEDIQEDRSNR